MVTPNSNKHFQMLATFEILPWKTFHNGPIHSRVYEIITWLQELRTKSDVYCLEALSLMFTIQRISWNIVKNLLLRELISKAFVSACRIRIPFWKDVWWQDYLFKGVRNNHMISGWLNNSEIKTAVIKIFVTKFFKTKHDLARALKCPNNWFCKGSGEGNSSQKTK